jgi:hypothetical protein
MALFGKNTEKNRGNCSVRDELLAILMAQAIAELKE